ncbi:MAG: type IX secretion system membrane protein PorP/SprF [Bacteroidales bacterium]|nr:type IX secretion system membrane protein PorP/SprF [Bacteroidales bacterium]
MNRVLLENEQSGGENTAILGKNRAIDVDFSASLLFYTNRVWFGGAIDHLLRPDLSFYSVPYVVPYKISGFGGFQLIKYKRLLKPIDETLSFAYLYKKQDKQQQLDIGLYWHKMPLVLGLWYRGLPFVKHDYTSMQRGDAVAILVGYKIDNFTVNYSYDFTISNLLPAAWGAHEVALVLNLKPRPSERNVVPCLVPNFSLQFEKQMPALWQHKRQEQTCFFCKVLLLI